jgi:hypothetical protein
MDHSEQLKMLSQICANCQNILGLSSDKKRDQYFQLHTPFEVETASAQGCHLCIMLAGQIREFRKQNSLDSRDALFARITTREIKLLNSNNIAVGDVISLREFEIPYPQIGGIMDRTDSDASFAVASNWLSTCKKSHSSCGGFKSNRCKLPTRLLRISRTEVGYMIRLCVSNIPSDTQYTTLSHCWGSLRILTLQRRYIESFQRDIPIYKLTKTFQDAISVTYRLGFRYIWIDSLCIIQDDPEDWQRESVLMESVYGGSSLNIAASAASDGSTGCFFKRNPYRVEVCRLMRPGFSSNIPSLHYSLESDFYSRNVERSPLSERAWVFQELYLAPRILSFGADQIFWECRELIACESFPRGIPPILLPTASWKRLREHDSDSNNHWTDIVSSYSLRSLTRESDKLIALSGIAKQFAERFNGQYLAGLWKENIVEQLAWFVSTWDVTRPKTYRAPSWSWASVNGRIHFRQEYWETRIDHIRLVDAQVTATKSGPFGEVENAFLQLLSRALVKARVSVDQDLEKGNLQASGFELPSYNVWYDTESFKPSENMYCLPLYENNTSFVVLMIGLLVEVVRDQPGTFRRVGRFRIQDKSAIADFEAKRNLRTACAEDSVYQLPVGVDDLGKQLYILKLI